MLGVIDEGWGKTCTPISDRLWWASIFLDTRELLRDRAAAHSKLTNIIAKIDEVKRKQESDALETYEELMLDLCAQKDKLETKIHVFDISACKLCADFMFCTIDVFDLNKRLRLSDGWQVFSGLSAALLGTWKLYIKSQ